MYVDAEMETPPPPVRMVQLLAGFQVSQAIYVAVKLGVPDALANGPKPVEELARMADADPGSLRRLLRTLASLGMFAEPSEGTFALTPLGETLVGDTPGSMRDLAVMWMETHYAPFAGLLETVRTGRNAAETYYGEPFFSWLARDHEQVDRFSGAMANLTDGIKVGAVAAYDFSEARLIVDVGAADGALLATILGRTPEASGIAFDLPHVVAAAEPAAKRFELGERLRFEGGDFFGSVPAGGDTYLLSSILHDWSDADAARILRTIHDAAHPGARVVAFELVSPPGDTPHMSKMIDLTMLAMMNGRERTEGELRALFSDAGFGTVSIVPTPTPISIVEAAI